MSAASGEGGEGGTASPPGADGEAAPEAEANEQIARRREKLAALRAAGNPYPNDFRPSASAAEVHAECGALAADALAAEPRRFAVAGRMMTRRVMGKASFAHLQDGSGRLQLYVRRDDLEGGGGGDGDGGDGGGGGPYREFRRWDIGDLVGAEGTAIRTRTGELSLQVDSIRLLAKALRPLPEKFHGLADREIKYRRRYLDLIVNAEARAAFRARTRMVDFIRRFFAARGFLEVETPMMQPVASGAMARPFETWHNALDIPLYLRVAPELYLKRLVVGGFERVFEINRNFRNEGLSTRHNPEFTMLEFYQAYADFRDLMELTEELLGPLAETVAGAAAVEWQGRRVDFGGGPFERLTVREAVLRHEPALAAVDFGDPEALRAAARGLGLELAPATGPGKALVEIFEHRVEPRLIAPTFVTHYPAEVSPLSRRNEEDPSVTDRFELFAGGQEIANGFSELNDPDEQAARFREQARLRAGGDEEAMAFDEDYVTALEYGMPPTAGEGVGIDRLAMLLTGADSIRDVILFPHLRPREGRGEAAADERAAPREKRRERPERPE